eukprot:jgi/Chlat1/7464/Chrsp6S07500
MGPPAAPPDSWATQVASAASGVHRAAAALPAGKDFHYHSNFKTFASAVTGLKGRARGLLQRIPTDEVLPEDVLDAHEWLGSVLDDAFERVDTALDKQRLSFVAEQQTKLVAVAVPAKAKKAAVGAKQAVPFHVASLPRPQLQFRDTLDNSNTPFVPPPVEDYSNLQQEEDSCRDKLQAHARLLGIAGGTGSPYGHPLEVPTHAQLAAPLDATPFTLVDTPAALQSLVKKLQAAREIAIDLENHSYRSFQGFTCLMQVSTRAEDFIVDTLVLRSHIRGCLQSIFVDASKVKVLHGCDKDVQWLQRDFGIYLVNVFDTGQAARMLQLPSFGLKYLLEHFCGVTADKRYQLADWRLRPLPPAMLKYAREDTHYLLYIYDRLRMSLHDLPTKDGEPSKYVQVLQRSNDLAAKLYQKELFTETSYLKLYRKSERPLSPEQLSVFAGLYAWRDRIARLKDEGCGYVLPNHLLFKLAELMPVSLRALHSLIRGSAPFSAQHAKELVDVIKQAKEQAAHPPPGLQADAAGAGPVSRVRDIPVRSASSPSSSTPSEDECDAREATSQAKATPSGRSKSEAAATAAVIAEEGVVVQPAAAIEDGFTAVADGRSTPPVRDDAEPPDQDAPAPAALPQQPQLLLRPQALTAVASAASAAAPAPAPVIKARRAVVIRAVAGSPSMFATQATRAGAPMLAAPSSSMSAVLAAAATAVTPEEEEARRKAESIRASLQLSFHAVPAPSGMRSSPPQAQREPQRTSLGLAQEVSEPVAVEAEAAMEDVITLPETTAAAPSWRELRPATAVSQSGAATTSGAAGLELPKSVKEKYAPAKRAPHDTVDAHDGAARSSKLTPSKRGRSAALAAGLLSDGSDEEGETDSAIDSAKAAHNRETVQPFDYAAARATMGVQPAEPRVERDAAAAGKSYDPSVKSKANGRAAKVFDPHAYLHLQVDLKPGKRSQVFPRSGNRTATFKD